MDRHELEMRRRSIAMLSPRAPALDREQAMALLEELQALQACLERLRDGLRKLAEEQ